MAANPWAGFFEEEFGFPKAGYFSYQDQWKTPNMKKFFQGQFSNIQNQYMGQLGQQIRQGQAPTLELADFLKNYGWEQQFREQKPPEGTNRYNPFTRWILP